MSRLGCFWTHYAAATQQLYTINSTCVYRPKLVPLKHNPAPAEWHLIDVLFDPVYYDN